MRYISICRNHTGKFFSLFIFSNDKTSINSRRLFFPSCFNSLRLKDDDSEVLRMLDYNETVIGSKSSIIDTKFDDDVVEGSNLYLIGPACGAVLLIFTLWYRKRQYDKIGIHKKIEFDFP